MTDQLPRLDTSTRGERATASSRFELVLICTGNRARSPIAEGFLRCLLADLPVDLRSLGTLELGAVPPLPKALAAASAHGLDISAHRARSLSGVDLAGADLVLGFERPHLAAAVVAARAAQDRTFLIRELVELIEETQPAVADPVERARQTIALAHTRRGDRISTRLAELGDPLGRDRDFYRDTVQRLGELSVRLAAGLFGEGAIRPLPRLEMPSGHGRRRPPLRRVAFRRESP
jgi:protein-tyrosine-phosphatase